MNAYNQLIDFRKTKPQKYFDPWDRRKRIVFSLGRCPVCNVLMFGFKDEPFPDPRGVIGRHTAYCLEPSEYDSAGDPFVICFDCSNTRETYERGLAMAKKGWLPVNRKENHENL